MKSKETLRNMTYAIDTAKATYWNAVKQNLIELDKDLRIVDEDRDEELGYPDGLLLSVHNKHGQLVDCVYDMVKAKGDKVYFHQAYWDDGDDDYWQSSDDIAYDNLTILCDYIEWPEDMGGDEEPEYVWVFTGEQAWDGEYADVIVHAFTTEDAAVKYMHDFLLDDGGDESIRQYVERKDWEVEIDVPMLYRAFKQGYYGTDHIELTITKCEIK